MLLDFFSVGPDGALRIAGVRLVGFDAVTGRKLLLTIAFVAAILTISAVAKRITHLILKHRDDVRAHFWTKQGIQIFAAVLIVVSFVSIWFDNPGRYGTAFAVISAGIAVASQKLITSFAGYFVILRGSVFNVGDRILMGKVRGDVIALGFIRTTIMEMGQAPGEQADDPSMWVEARQYTGRIVSVTNDQIFESAVYNYSRAVPYIWEEMRIPIRYGADTALVERVLLEAANKHTTKTQELSEKALEELARRAFIRPADVRPRVYFRLTDNWLEMAVRFIVADHGIREVKDAMSRDILQQLTAANIGIASATFEVVGVPELRVRTES